jgi:ClpP class serine protease
MSALAVIEHAQQSTPPRVDERQVVEVLRREHGDNEDALVTALVDYLREHDDVLAVLARRMVHAALATRRRSQRRPVDRARDQAEARSIAARFKAEIVLDITCPNGKKLRHCTGAECGLFGDMFARIAQHVPPGALVGECLLESEARKLLAAQP